MRRYVADLNAIVTKYTVSEILLQHNSVYIAIDAR